MIGLVLCLVWGFQIRSPRTLIGIQIQLQQILLNIMMNAFYAMIGVDRDSANLHVSKHVVGIRIEIYGKSRNLATRFEDAATILTHKIRRES